MPFFNVERGKWFCPSCQKRVRAIEIEGFKTGVVTFFGLIVGTATAISKRGQCPACRCDCLIIEPRGGSDDEVRDSHQ